MSSPQQPPPDGSRLIPSPPYYLLGPLPGPELSGRTNLIEHSGLEQSYHKYCTKRVKDNLSAFLPNVGSLENLPVDAGSSLRALIEKPPVTGRELAPLVGSALSGFRLHSGALPEQYQLLHNHHGDGSEGEKSHRRGKDGRRRREGGEDDAEERRRQRRERRKETEGSERKKRKKEKKRKRLHSPTGGGRSIS